MWKRVYDSAFLPHKIVKNQFKEGGKYDKTYCKRRFLGGQSTGVYLKCFVYAAKLGI